MLTDKHTITIEPVELTRGEPVMAVVERFNGDFVKVCYRADQLPEGQSLADEARGWARTYGATFDLATAVAEAALVAL